MAERLGGGLIIDIPLLPGTTAVIYWDMADGQVVLVKDDKVRVAKPATSGSPTLKMAYGSTVLELDAEVDSRLQSKGIKASTDVATCGAAPTNVRSWR